MSGQHHQRFYFFVVLYGVDLLVLSIEVLLGPFYILLEIYGRVSDRHQDVCIPQLLNLSFVPWPLL